MSPFAPLSEPPYYAVIFSNKKSGDLKGYDQMAEAMTSLAEKQPGYVGIESVSQSDGFTITISYWADVEALKNWKQVSEHLFAQKMGKEKWYDHYIVRVAKVERAYDGPSGR